MKNVAREFPVQSSPRRRGRAIQRADKRCHFVIQHRVKFAGDGATRAATLMCARLEIFRTNVVACDCVARATNLLLALACFGPKGVRTKFALLTQWQGYPCPGRRWTEGSAAGWKPRCAVGNTWHFMTDGGHRTNLVSISKYYRPHTCI